MLTKNKYAIGLQMDDANKMITQRINGLSPIKSETRKNNCENKTNKIYCKHKLHLTAHFGGEYANENC